MTTPIHPRVLVTGAGGLIGHHLVYALAADMGGMGFISASHATILRNSGEFGLETRIVRLRHVDGPQGVRGRSSDNRRLREVLGWEPSVTLHQGLESTYRWIEKQVSSRRPPWAAAGR
jgi:nucleoside-diphosphate-sugar epimerase